MVIFTIAMPRGERAGASGKTDGVPRGLPSVDASRINSEARGVSGVRFKLALDLGGDLPMTAQAGNVR